MARLSGEEGTACRPERKRAAWRVGFSIVVAATILVAVIETVTGEGQEFGETMLAQSRSFGPGVLVAGIGAAETYAHCIVCHSERLVAQQGLTRQGWEEVIELMTEEHGMAPIEALNLDRVLGYLSTHYGPDRPNFPLQ